MESNVSVFVALAAGFLSFVSPCVLPLVPSYLVFITGLSFDDLETNGAKARNTAGLHALAFVLGFSLIFVLLGATATALGTVVLQHTDTITRIGGIVVIGFALYLLGVFRFGALATEKRIPLTRKPQGFAGSTLVGMTFALGWTPCIGPVLGTILMLAGTSGSVGTGVLLLGAYALGMGIPFIIAGVAFPQFMRRVRFINHYQGWLTKTSGALLLAIGLLMVTNSFARFTGWASQVMPTIELEQNLIE